MAISTAVGRCTASLVSTHLNWQALDRAGRTSLLLADEREERVTRMLEPCDSGARAGERCAGSGP